MQPSSSAAPGRAAFVFIFVTVALDMLALGVMAPVLPKLVIELEGGDVAAAAGITGQFGFAWAAMQLVCSPLLGALSDRFGRRPIVLLSSLGLGLDYVLMAVAPTVGWLFVGRVVSGITAASFSTAGAYIADVTPPDQRAARFGMLGAAFGLGFVIGPALGGVLGDVDLRLPFWVAGGLSLVSTLYGFFILPESLPPDRRRAFSWRRANPIGSLAWLRSHPQLVRLAAIAVLYYVAHESLPSMFVLYTDHRYGWSETMTGIALAGIGVSSTLVSAVVVAPVVARLGERRSLLLGLLCGGAGFAIYGVAPTGGLFLLGMPLIALWGLATPAMQALMTRHVAATEQGQLQGALASVRGVTGMIGPLVFTQTFAATIDTGAVDLPGATYLLAAALLLASAALAWRLTAGYAIASSGSADSASALLRPEG